MLTAISEAQNDWLEVGGILTYKDALPMDKINDLSLAKDVVAGK
jgi:hypothetical protein